MAEEFPNHEHYYLYETDLPRNFDHVEINQTPHVTAKIITANEIREQRRFERENYTQKSLPSIKTTYGSIYTKPHSIVQSESEPLLGIYQPRYLCGQPVELSRYRRNQIFLFFYIVFYVGYLIIGSICFQRLEFGHEQEIRQDFRNIRRAFLDDNPSVRG